MPAPDGTAVAGAAVAVPADGTARFLPALYPACADVAGPVTASTADATSEFARSAGTVLTVGAPPPSATPVPLDVAFLLDATGSMGDEIDRRMALKRGGGKATAQFDESWMKAAAAQGGDSLE